MDTTGDMRQNFETVYNQLRTKYKFSEPVEYVRRIKRKDDRIAALQSPIENGWLCFSTKLSRTLFGPDEDNSLSGISTTDPTPRKARASQPVVITTAQHREQRRTLREQEKEEGPAHVFHSYV